MELGYRNFSQNLLNGKLFQHHFQVVGCKLANVSFVVEALSFSEQSGFKNK